jgi:uncharacterized sodium:solute symporter family permease YidK
MRSTYKYLAFIICGLVVLQATFVVYGDAGLFKWISEDGGVLDKAALEDNSISFPGMGGFMAHGMNGMMVIPLVALATLVVGFFTKVKGTAARGGIIVGLVVLQVALGLTAHSVPALGPLHGINAFALFLTALSAARLITNAERGELPAAPKAGLGSTVPGQTEAPTTQIQA